MFKRRSMIDTHMTDKRKKKNTFEFILLKKSLTLALLSLRREFGINSCFFRTLLAGRDQVL